MRPQIFLPAPALLSVCAVLPVCFAQPTGSPAADEIVARMLKVENAQEQNLQSYRVVRAYALRNNDGSKAVDLVAQIDYDGRSGKRIQVIDERGSDGMLRRALRKVLDAEVHASNTDGRKESRLTPENYRFRLAGSEMHEGRKCFVLELSPKRKTKFLIEGRAWIDAEDNALLAIEGRPAASVSFWVGKPYIKQSYEKVGDFWLLAHNHSVADAKLVGRITLTIETRDFEMGGTKVVLAKGRRRASGVVLD